MPDLDWNLKRWGETHDWSRRGDEWSDGAGGPEGQWFWWLYPRIHRFLPTKSILEIAPGFGRWTQFLLGHTEQLIGVDIAERCVVGSKERFAGSKNFACYVNDGYTMPMVADRSISFVFSFGSLIHAESDVMESYVREIARVLSADGVAFLHHSNAAACGYTGKPPRSHAGTVSAQSVEEMGKKAALVTVLQETFSWGTPIQEPISCMTILASPDSKFSHPTTRFENERLDADIEYIEKMSGLYA